MIGATDYQIPICKQAIRLLTTLMASVSFWLQNETEEKEETEEQEDLTCFEFKLKNQATRDFCKCKSCLTDQSNGHC